MYPWILIHDWQSTKVTSSQDKLKWFALCMTSLVMYYFQIGTQWPSLLVVFFLWCFRKLSFLATKTTSFSQIFEQTLQLFWLLLLPCGEALPKEKKPTTRGACIDNFYHNILPFPFFSFLSRRGGGGGIDCSLPKIHGRDNNINIRIWCREKLRNSKS